MIFITGASSGIGEACAHVFAQRKQNLILTARRLNLLEKLANELREKHQVEVHTFSLDVANRKNVESFVQKEAALLKKITVLVNNAGVGKGMDKIQDGNLDDWNDMIDTNLKGFLYVSRLLLPFFLEKNNGHIVNIGSVAARWVYPKGNVYCATKNAIASLTQGMRLDLNGTKIRVTEIVPGMVETNFSEVRLRSKEKAKAVYAGMTPLTATDVAESVLWAVERPAHVNIQEIVLYPTDQASTSVVSRTLNSK